MSRRESKSNTSAWTGENLKKLLAAMKTNIQKQDTEYPYTKGLKAMDWTKVAFPPFSPEECQEKWGVIFQKMRKTRTLTELIVEAEDVISNPLKRKKIHPEAPKKPCPPNAMFYEENWAKFQEKHPNMKKSDLLKLINQTFKELSKDEKAQYEKKHKLAVTEYNRRMQDFSERYGKPSKYKRKFTQDKDGVSVDAPESELGAEDAVGLLPKPPLSGYNVFCKEQLESMTDVSRNSHLRICSQRWRDLTERQRNEYKTRCHELRQQHSVELHKILRSMDKEQQQRVLQKHGLKRPRIRQKKEFPDEPQMPPVASNIIFFKNQMKCLEKEFPDSKERFVKVSQKWKDLSVEEKESYSKMATKQFTEYKVELKKWFQILSPEQQEDYLTHNPSKSKYVMPPTLRRRAPEVKVPARKHVSDRPSDSEDEDIEDSSNDEEACEEDEDEEEEGEDLTFEMF